MPSSPSKSLKICVTGAAGTIGTPVATHLAARGFDVIGVDRVLKRDRPYPIRIANLLNREAAYEALAGADAIVHLANHPNAHGRDAQTTISENVAMNTHVFQAAAELGIPKVIFASTVQVFTGDRHVADRATRPSILPYLPLDGEIPAQPENAYGLSKQLSETMLGYYARNHGLHAIVVRFPFVVMSDRWLRHFGQVHDRYRLDEAFTYLEVGDATSLIETIVKTDLPGFRIYFPGSQRNTLDRPASEIASEFFPEVPLKCPLNGLTSLVDNSAIQRDTGWFPTR